MNSGPKVSLGILTGNCAAGDERRWLVELANDLRSQEYTDFEIVIHNNGSTDGTFELIRELFKDLPVSHFLYSRSYQSGVDNFKRVYAASTGKYFAWIADHDRFHPSFLKDLVFELDANDSAVLVYPQTVLIGRGSEYLSTYVDPIDTRGLNAGDRALLVADCLDFCNPIYGLWRADVLNKILFVEARGNDHVMLYEAALHGDIFQIKKPLFRRRRNREISHEENLARMVDSGFPKYSVLKKIVPMLNLAYLHAVVSERFFKEGGELQATAAVGLLVKRFRGEMVNESQKFDEALRGMIAPNIPTENLVEKAEVGEIVQVVNALLERYQSSNLNLARPGSWVPAQAPFDGRYKITVIIPAYNREKYVGLAIESAVRQMGNDVEVLVVDDGSTDGTLAQVEEYEKHGVRLVKKEHSGAPETRNRAIAEARGEYLLWLDSDDVLLPGVIDRYRQVVNEYPQVDVVYGDLYVTDESLKIIDQREFRDWYGRNEQLLANTFFSNQIPNGGSLVRKACYERFGSYDVKFRRAHDYEFWGRVVKDLVFKHVGGHVMLWRWHDSNMSSGSVKIDMSYDVMAIESMLSRHHVRDLFPQLGWGEQSDDEVEALAYFNVANRFMSMAANNVASRYFKLAHERFPTEFYGALANFDESYYLNENHDVAEVVAAGGIASGLHHYFQYGFREGRKFKGGV